MHSSVDDLKGFYNSRTGRVVRRILQNRIRAFWPDVKGLRVMGCGYAVPYLRGFMTGAERVIALMHAETGAQAWPQGQGGTTKNLVCLTQQEALPIENASVDRILLVHALEFSGHSGPVLEELWRVLKPNGRLLMIVPNRAGLWAHADWSPFGHGTPYTVSQLSHLLQNHLFIHDRTEEALFMPPWRYPMILKSAGFCERVGRVCLPFVAGVHMVEAGKQVFAGANRHKGSAVKARGRGLLGRPVSEGAGTPSSRT